MPLGEKLKTLREEKRWSQRDLARQAKVRQALISERESGKKTDTMGQTLRRLARVLGVSVDYLVGTYDPHRSRGKRSAVTASRVPW
jgi:transcriptional regulator with XRE-family HTH domain